MTHSVRYAAAAIALVAAAGRPASAQTPPLVFTMPASDATAVELRVRPVVGERALVMWAGAGDFGVGVDVDGPRWTVRSIESMNVLRVDGRARPTFQQIEVVPTLFTRGSTSIAAGGGVREEWDGTRALLARALVGVDLGGGRLQGSLVMEHAIAALAVHDAADVVTTAGWSRRVNAHLALGVEGIGQDLEGFGDPAEAEGGARLIVGPSLHVRSRRGAWSASATAGPVLRSASTVAPSGAAPQTAGRRLGVFASASWTPQTR